MRKTILLTGFAFFVATLPAFSQNQDSVMVKKITDEILLNGKAYNNLYTL